MNPKHPRNHFEAIISYDDTLKIHINTKNFIEWEIFFFGYYEKSVVDYIKKKLPKGGVFVDVGAGIGCHALVASRIASKVIAIEPEELSRKKLLENVERNSLGNISIYPGAVSDCVGAARLYLPKKESSNQMVASLIRHDHNSDRYVDVEVVTLDELLKNELRVDFIKIDAEGLSQKVLLGAKEIIKKYRPIILYEKDNSDEMVLVDNI